MGFFISAICYLSEGGHICSRPFKVEVKCALLREDNI